MREVLGFSISVGVKMIDPITFGLVLIGVLGLQRGPRWLTIVVPAVVVALAVELLVDAGARAEQRAWRFGDGLVTQFVACLIDAALFDLIARRWRKPSA